MCVHVYNLHSRAAVDPWSDELRVLGNSADFLELIVQLDGKRLKGKRPFLPSQGVDRENCWIFDVMQKKWSFEFARLVLCSPRISAPRHTWRAIVYRHTTWLATWHICRGERMDEARERMDEALERSPVARDLLSSLQGWSSLFGSWIGASQEEQLRGLGLRMRMRILVPHSGTFSTLCTNNRGWAQTRGW